LNQITHLRPVILSGAPERCVSYKDRWRGVEGSRGCFPLACRLREFLPDTPFPHVSGLEILLESELAVHIVKLSIGQTATAKRNFRTVTGTGYEENSLRQHGKGLILRILRLRARHLRAAVTRRGAPLRMTEAGGMEEQRNREGTKSFSLLARLPDLPKGAQKPWALARRKERLCGAL